MTRRRNRLLVVVARERDDRAYAHVLGAFNADFMGDLPLEDYEREVQKLKETWTGDPSIYDFREVYVTFDGDLNGLFVEGEFEGRME